jgi:formylmethanofuran dehydrogenase subunit C
MLLIWLDKTTLPVDAAGLTPRALLGRSELDVAKLPVRVGNREAEVGDVFSVEPVEWGSGNAVLAFEGDLRHVRNIGRGLDAGWIHVQGHAGAFLGAGMSGGLIEVDGNAGDWAGAEMRGGNLAIAGHAGNGLGAGLPGSRIGMRDGVILVGGSVGEDAGRRMRRGLIAVSGAAGDGFGNHVIAGSLFAFGPVGKYVGLGMKRGSIALLGGSEVELLPTFAPTGRYRFPWLTIYLRRLASWGVAVPASMFSAAFERYNGDLAEGGQGEILVGSG